MVLCEICGEKPAEVKARIESSVLQVCSHCAGLGRVICKVEQPKPKPVLLAKDTFAEEVLTEDYAVKIRAARNLAKMTQEEFATKLNVNLAVLKAAESGKRLDLQTAKKIERALKIKLVEAL